MTEKQMIETLQALKTDIVSYKKTKNELIENKDKSITELNEKLNMQSSSLKDAQDVIATFEDIKKSSNESVQHLSATCQEYAHTIQQLKDENSSLKEQLSIAQKQKKAAKKPKTSQLLTKELDKVAVEKPQEDIKAVWPQMNKEEDKKEAIPTDVPDMLKKEKTFFDTVSKPILDKLDKPANVEVLEDAIHDGKPDSKEEAYRFGKTTQFVADKMEQFLREFIKADAGETNDAKTVATQQKMSDKTLEIFLNRLNRLTLKGRPLVEEKNGKYSAALGKEEMVKYVVHKMNSDTTK